MPQKDVHAARLRYAAHVDVGHERTPTARHALGKFAHDPLLLFGRHEDAHLTAGRTPRHLAQIGHRRIERHPQRTQKLAHPVVHAAGDHPLVGQHRDGKSLAHPHMQHPVENLHRNRTLGQHLAVGRQAMAAVDQNVSVESQPFERRKAPPVAARGDNHLRPASAQAGERFARRCGHLVRLETAQRTVDIEKEDFVHLFNVYGFSSPYPFHGGRRSL